jgi:hypothetical protein
MKHFILSVSLIFIIAGCKKDSVEYHLSDLAKSLSGFKGGSYWIYQNDSTIGEDSLFVKSLSIDNDPHEKNGDIDYTTEKFTCNIISTLFPQMAGSYQSIARHSYDGPEENYFSNGKWMAYWLTTTSQVTCGPTSTIIYHQNFQLNGLSYSNVTEIIEEVHLVNDYIPVVNFYIVPDIGVIKWNIQYKDGRTDKWSLLRSNIIRQH